MTFVKKGCSFLAFLSVVLCVAFTTPAWAELKIGYFDMQTVLEQSKWGKQAKDEFKRQKDKVKADVDLKTNSFKSLKEEFDKKSTLLDQDAKSKKIRELQEKRLESEKFVMQSTNQLTQLSNELSGPIIEKVMEIVRRIGREDKYDFVFEVQKGGLLYGTEKSDLTRRVIEELDKMPRPVK